MRHLPSALQAVLAVQRHEEDQWPAVPRLPKPDGLLAAFDASVPGCSNSDRNRRHRSRSAPDNSVADTMHDNDVAGHSILKIAPEFYIRALNDNLGNCLVR